MGLDGTHRCEGGPTGRGEGHRVAHMGQRTVVDGEADKAATAAVCREREDGCVK